MLPKENRLVGKKNYDRVQMEGTVAQFSDFGIATFDKRDTSPTRFGFVVSTKVAKKAVDRNNVKRILREAIRHNLIDIKPGLDVVFLTKSSIVKKSTSILAKEVQNALRQLAILLR